MKKYFVDKKKRQRVPLEFNGIQINCCKNPFCENFGKPALTTPVTKGRPKAGSKRIVDSYTIKGAGRKAPVLFCNKCRKSTTIKSNQAISEELDRIRPVFPIKGCPTNGCANANNHVEFSGCYQKIGKTSSGYQRYKCKLCKKTFSFGKTIRRQKKSYKNKEIFLDLVNQNCFRGMRVLNDLPSLTLSRKIDFIHSQCLKFSAAREARLPNMPFKKIEISTDRQDYIVNWNNRHRKKNTVFQGICSADNESNYVFAANVNFDPSLVLSDITAAANEAGDCDVTAPFKRYARLWTENDYQERIQYKEPEIGETDETQNVLHQLTIKHKSEDPEIVEVLTASAQLPINGVQVHAEYTMHAHFFYLKEMLGHAGNITFYLDDDSGINAAFTAAFIDEIASNKADGFFVKFRKGQTRSVRENYINENRSKYKKFIQAHGLKDDFKASLLMAKYNMTVIDPENNEWEHPVGTAGEPYKTVIHLFPDHSNMSDELAVKYLQANMRGVDRFFLNVRNKLSPLVRGIDTASHSNGKWHGKCPYNPQVVQKYLDIYRTYYNYVPKLDKKTTPAMRIGLAKGPVTIEDILYFNKV
ncbi:hypothetical protein [Halodesulfovibrio sp.]|jgi:hypothetical protein|uniref:hypothetical protein n=1 Tax=Halodesulfovibrio sp. TaxID=1912772 RepID=UPI0025D358D3|nr:hypothetical protein [Halodesulfovibrio sp.]MCT4534698.1 hypothetical protein [Halodesulfovibrio sp.]